MRLRLITVGTRVPEWIRTGTEEYRRRLPPECALEVVEIPPGRRAKGADPARAVRVEGERLLAAAGRARVWLLDERGAAWTTRELAGRLAGWMADGREVALLVGGADGLAAACRARAEGTWSLSPLTLPHLLVRVLVAEQIYRAWTLLRGHPYHRA